jgi:hypothetical protein
MTYITARFGVPVLPRWEKAAWRHPGISMMESARRENARMNKVREVMTAEDRRLALADAQHNVNIGRWEMVAKAGRPLLRSELSAMWGISGTAKVIETGVELGAMREAGKVKLARSVAMTWEATPEFIEEVRMRNV